MVEYSCERCHYITNRKIYYINHLNRKNTCKSIHSSISIEELLKELNCKSSTYSCIKYFKKKIKNPPCIYQTTSFLFMIINGIYYNHITHYVITVWSN